VSVGISADMWRQLAGGDVRALGRSRRLAVAAILAASALYGCAPQASLENMLAARSLSTPPDLSPAVPGAPPTPSPAFGALSAVPDDALPASEQKLDVTDQPNPPGVLWRAFVTAEGVDMTRSDGIICAGLNYDPLKRMRPRQKTFLSCSDGQNVTLQLGQAGVVAAATVIIGNEIQPVVVVFR
jgi:hypothetical protein